MNEILFSITDLHKYNMNFAGRASLRGEFNGAKPDITETSMNKEIAGESVGKKQVKASIIAFTF